MTLYNTSKPHDIDAQTLTSGTVVPNVPQAGGVTLGIGTYLFALGTERSSVIRETALASAHIKWAAAVAGIITVETCNFPATLSGNGQGAPDVTDFDATAGNWIQENPSTAYVGVTGTGNSATALTITMGGTNAGGCMIELGNLAAMRCRIKIVTTVGGLVRVNGHGKLGA